MIRKFRTSNILFASLGIVSLFYFSVGLVIALGREPLGIWMLITSPVLAIEGIVLNVRGLRRISDGTAGEYDLVLT